METLTIPYHKAEQIFDETLDDIYDVVEIAGLTYTVSHALKRVDPVAYRTALLEWADAEGIEIEE